MVSVNSSVAKIIEEHRELERMIKELHGFLRDPQPEFGVDGSHAWAGELAQHLVKFHQKVFLHIREEEDSGVLGELAEEFPRAVNSVQRLYDEHEHFLDEIRVLVSGAMVYAENKGPSELDLRNRAKKLLNKLSRHKVVETDLIMRVHWEDLGGKE